MPARSSNRLVLAATVLGTIAVLVGSACALGPADHEVPGDASDQRSRSPTRAVTRPMAPRERRRVPGHPARVQPGGDPELGALANNGGPTQTRLPATTSPLGGLVPIASCTIAVDQRSQPRPAGLGCEAGSVEIVEAPAGPEPITGTSRADVLFGTPGPDRIDGLAGHDLLSGLAGDDTLQGGPGNDLLIGGPGTDTLLGGPGNDILLATVRDTVDGGPGLDLCVFPNRLPRIC